MTKLKAFKAIIFNPEKVKDFSRVVCPPYDIISPQRQEYYHKLDPHNLIHILLGKDIPPEDKYVRAAKYFNEWLKTKIFIQDEKPAIYFCSQQYKIKGETKIRLGFIALLQLDDKKSSVFAHEHTRLEPKEDRLKLLRQVKANLSPIFVVASDHNRIIQRTYQKYVQGQNPFIDITDDEKITHKLWRLNQPELLAEITGKMQDENIFIADGHHRYEVACIYRNEVLQNTPNPTGEESCNYIMACFTSVDNRGLTIFPIHRLVKVGPQFNLDDFKIALMEYFDPEEIKDKARFLFLMEKAGSIEHVLGMYKDKKYWLLRLKNIKILDRLITDKPAEYRTLDVSVLNYIVLNKILGIPLEDKSDIEFIPDTDEVIQRVDNDASYVAFFLNPVRIQQVISVALKGERMPPKSTYFYPKVLSGLVINKFNEDKS